MPLPLIPSGRRPAVLPPHPSPYISSSIPSKSLGTLIFPASISSFSSRIRAALNAGVSSSPKFSTAAIHFEIRISSPFKPYLNSREEISSSSA